MFQVVATSDAVEPLSEDVKRERNLPLQGDLRTRKGAIKKAKIRTAFL